MPSLFHFHQTFLNGIMVFLIGQLFLVPVISDYNLVVTGAPDTPYEGTEVDFISHK